MTSDSVMATAVSINRGWLSVLTARCGANTVQSIDGIDRLSSRLPLTSLKHELAVIWAPAPTICGRPAAHRVLIRVADDELAAEGTHLRKGDAQISSGSLATWIKSATRMCWFIALMCPGLDTWVLC